MLLLLLLLLLASGAWAQEKIDLVVVGDGYWGRELRTFRDDAQSMLDELFQVPPFSEYRHLFAVRLVEVESPRGGFAFGSELVSRGRVRVTRKREVLETASREGPVDIVVVLTKLAGRATGGTIDGVPAPVVTRDRYTSLAHELGHSLGGLADEYESSRRLADREAKPLSAYGASDAPYPNVTLAAFIDPSDAETLRRTAKWGHFLDLPGAFPLVSAYQGGLYNTVGVWRPSYRCVMRSSRGAPFCPVCHEVLVRKMYALCGLTFDHERYHREHPLTEWN